MAAALNAVTNAQKARKAGWVRARVCMCVIHVHMCVLVCNRVCMFVCIRVRACVYVGARVCVFVSMCIYACVLMCIVHVCMCL